MIQEGAQSGTSIRIVAEVYCNTAHPLRPVHPLFVRKKLAAALGILWISRTNPHMYQVL